MFACLNEFTEKNQVLLKIICSKTDQHFTTDLTLTLHEHFESEMVVHGKSKEWLKYHMVMFLTANNAKKENLKPRQTDASVVSI